VVNEMGKSNTGFKIGICISSGLYFIAFGFFLFVISVLLGKQNISEDNVARKAYLILSTPASYFFEIIYPTDEGLGHLVLLLLFHLIWWFILGAILGSIISLFIKASKKTT
jgi:hypothetical protein